MKQIKINPILTDQEVKKLEGTFFTKDLIKYRITEDTKVFNEKGDILAVYKRLLMLGRDIVISKMVCKFF